MAKSLRSKREKRLRAIRREMVEPLYDQKDAAKQAAMEAALAAPKLPVKKAPETTPIEVEPAVADHELDVEMEDANQKQKKTESLKPMGKKMKKKLKLAKRNCKGKGKLRRRHV